MVDLRESLALRIAFLGVVMAWSTDKEANSLLDDTWEVARCTLEDKLVDWVATKLFGVMNVPPNMPTKIGFVYEFCTFMDLMKKEGLASFRSDWISLVEGAEDGKYTFPGTKWCGETNIPKSFDEIAPAPFNKADVCCREHHKCMEVLVSGRCKHGICNTNPYTMRHCSCDQEFHACLKNTNKDLISLFVAIRFFDGIHLQCFMKSKVKIGCNETEKHECCSNYVYNQTAPEKYQIYCNPSFRGHLNEEHHNVQHHPYF